VAWFTLRHQRLVLQLPDRETTAAAKILIDQSNDQIVGAHLLGPEYGELVNTLGLAIKLGLTTRQLKSATATYPTVGSDLGSML